jgi:hypothetical protein
VCTTGYPIRGDIMRDETSGKWRTVHIYEKDYPLAKYLAAQQRVQLGELFEKLLHEELARSGGLASIKDVKPVAPSVN